MNRKFRLVLSHQNSAKVNMATDEALAQCFEENDTPILRLYTWEKSFTIGVGQKISQYEYLDEYKGNYAKRITGGGVLFHGSDLSYSLIIPPKYLDGLNVKESYEKICSFLLAFYKQLGLDAKYVKDDENLQLSKSQFCQVGFEAYDIVVSGLKIGGNAQRRTKKFIFQHGSIPILQVDEKSNLKSEIGHDLHDLGIDISFEKAQELLIEVFQNTFDVSLETSGLNKKEEEKLTFLLKDKYDYAK